MLTISEIRSFCMDSVYSRGLSYYNAKRVTDFKVSEDTENGVEHVSSSVRGSSGEFYQITFDVTGDKKLKKLRCGCPYVASYGYACKHIVATALRYREYEKQRDQEKKLYAPERRRYSSTDEGIIAIIRSFAGNGQETSAASVKIEPIFTSRDEGMEMEITIGNKRMYVVRNLAGLIDNLTRRREYTINTTKFTFGWTPEELDENSAKLVSAIADSQKDMGSSNRGYYISSADQDRRIYLIGTSLERILKLQGNSILLDRKTVEIREENPPIAFKLTGFDDKAVLTCPSFQLFEVPQRSYVLHQHILYHCTEDYNRVVLPLLRAFSYKGKSIEKELRLSPEDYTAFSATVLPAFEGLAEIQQENLDLSEYAPIDPDFSLYLQFIQRNMIGAEAVVCYGADTYDLFDTNAVRWRDPKEKQLIGILESYFPECVRQSVEAYDGRLVDSGSDETEIKRIDPKNLTARAVTGEDGIWNLFSGGLEALSERCSVYIDEALFRARIHPAPKVSVGVAIKGGLLDMNFNVEDLDMNEIAGILASYRLRKKYHRMKNGDFMRLEDNALSTLSELSEGLMLSDKQLRSGSAKLPASRALYVDEVLNEAQGVSMDRSANFRRLIRDMRDFRNSDYTEPEGLNASLRPYQTDGYQWLCTLYDLKLGGVLADDMGLGKTLQMIAMFLHAAQADSRFCALVVAPTSVLFNWENEVRRFAPQMSVQIISGTAAERQQQIEALSKFQVNITSYDMLKRDVEAYEDKTFSCLVLDEAQYVKNAATKAAHSVVSLKAEHRFAMTGTPIENRVSDLWSIFNCVMQGYLYSYDAFRREIELPIMQDGDEVTQKRLSRMVAPFLLRRKKSDVLKDLPEKLEENVFVRLEGEQKKFYEASRVQLLGKIASDSESDFKDSRMQILAALTRIRQLCCSPELCCENYGGESAKVNACIELLHNATASGHQVLVFSQFTSMLELLISRWDESYLYLSGKDSKARRQEMIEEFSAGKASVFFISLKAGGTGLNLTQADVVIHCDPWWNVAAQNQATDRAHRIGQKNVVHVIRLVAKDTIEEKIIELQEKKSALAGAIYETGENAAAMLNRDNLIELLSERTR